MFTALGSPKGALLGLSAAALILAITYSISAAPIRWIDVARLAPAPVATPQSLPGTTPAAPAPTVQLAVAEIDDTVTGAIGTAPQLGVTQTVPVPLSGSTGFVDALALIKDKQYADAYAAGATLPSAIERRTIQWAAIYYGGGAVAPDAVRRFEEDAPDFVSTGVFKTRLEQARIKSRATPADIIKYLGGAMPNTIDAQIKLAAAYVEDGQTKRGAAIARSIWVDQFLDATPASASCGTMPSPGSTRGRRPIRIRPSGGMSARR